MGFVHRLENPFRMAGTTSLGIPTDVEGTSLGERRDVALESSAGGDSG